MPIYEYLCKNCHHSFDLMQKFNDVPVSQCPACHQKTVEKQISAAGFQLKGTGWYVTDFKNNHLSKESKKPAETKQDTVDKAADTASKKDKTSAE